MVKFERKELKLKSLRVLDLALDVKNGREGDYT